MEEVIKSMSSYKEFKAFCNEKACTGQWDNIEALGCLQVIKEIDSIKVKKGLFKKKKTLEAREEAFNRIKEEL